jgi:hypothetical protein
VSHSPPASASATIPRSALIAIVLAFVAVHLALALVDFHRPEVFLRADRAVMRMRDIDQLLAAGNWADAREYLGSHGVVGDYAAHAVLYGIGGRPAVILCQVLLLFASGFAVVRLAALLGMSPALQAASLTLYFTLPNSLVFAHQLSTEALEVPLLVISTCLVCESLRRSSTPLLLASALLLAMATLIRPITLLWPAAVAAIAALQGRRLFAVAFLAVACAPVLLWMTFIFQQTGTFGLGESNHSLARNLYLKLAETQATMPRTEAAEVGDQYLTRGDQGRMSALEYANVALRHPLPFISEAGRDALVFFGKSGIERLTRDYGSDAQFKAFEHVQGGWRQQLDTSNPLTTLRNLWRIAGMTLLVSLSASLLFVTLMIFALYGAFALARRVHSRSEPPVVRFTAANLIVLPVYILVFSLVVVALQSRQRAPCEFALVLLAVYGWDRFRSRTRKERRTAAERRPSCARADPA